MPKRRTRLPPSVEQAQGENEVGQLALPVCVPLRIASALPLQTLEVDMAEMRGKAGDQDDAG